MASFEFEVDGINGDDTNGGGFNPTVPSPGTDYSYGAQQQTFYYNDLAVVGYMDDPVSPPEAYVDTNYQTYPGLNAGTYYVAYAYGIGTNGKHSALSPESSPITLAGGMYNNVIAMDISTLSIPPETAFIITYIRKSADVGYKFNAMYHTTDKKAVWLKYSGDTIDSITNNASNKIQSDIYGFEKALNGNIINISGSGWISGRACIVSCDGGIATITEALAGVGTSNGIGTVGGALKTIDAANNSLPVCGHDYILYRWDYTGDYVARGGTIWIHNNTEYNILTGIKLKGGPDPRFPVSIIGYTSTHGDNIGMATVIANYNGTTGSMFATGTDGLTNIIGYTYIIKNIMLDGNYPSYNKNTGLYASGNTWYTNIIVENCRFTRFNEVGISHSVILICNNCEFDHCDPTGKYVDPTINFDPDFEYATALYSGNSNLYVNGCTFHHNNGVPIVVSNGEDINIKNCIFYENGWVGNEVTDGASILIDCVEAINIERCVFHNCLGSAIQFNQDYYWPWNINNVIGRIGYCIFNNTGLNAISAHEYTIASVLQKVSTTKIYNCAFNTNHTYDPETFINTENNIFLDGSPFVNELEYDFTLTDRVAPLIQSVNQLVSFAPIVHDKKDIGVYQHFVPGMNIR